jgi:tetratricopeptide (TPR) repeat protein
MTRGWIVGLCAIGLLTACGKKHETAWEAKATNTQGGGGGDPAALAAEGDQHWDKRDDRKELEAAIAAWDRAVAGNPADGPTLSKLARACYLLADGHLAFDGDAAKDQYLKTHQRGMAYAERALIALNPQFKAKVEGGAKMDQALDTLTANEVPALYWWTSNLGKWANAQGFSTVLKYKNTIKAYIEKCLSLDEHYFYSAPHRYLGVIYAKAPAIAGGDLKKAKEHFDASLAHSPNYLATTVLWAEFYAVKSDDKAGYKEKLEWVLKQPDDVIPEIVAETKIEKKKAEKLLSMIEEKF